MTTESPLENQNSSRMFMTYSGRGYMITDEIAESVRKLCSQLTYILGDEVRVVSAANAQQDSRNLVYFVSDSPEVQAWLNQNIYLSDSMQIMKEVQRLALELFSRHTKIVIPFEY